MIIPHHIYRVMGFAGYGQTIHLNPLNPVVSTFVKDKTLITFQNMSGATQIIEQGACIGVLDMRSKDGAMTSFDWEFPADDEGNFVLYAHIFANSLEPTKLAKEDS